MNEITKLCDGIALNVLEAVGHGAVRVERARRELDEISRLGTETAMKLRVVANCLDSEKPEKIRGMLEGGMFSVDNFDTAYSPACEYWEVDPSVTNVFLIPEGVKELMERMHEAEKLLHSYGDMLNSSLESYLRNCVGVSE